MDKYNKLVDYLNSKGVKVKTPEDIINYIEQLEYSATNLIKTHAKEKKQREGIKNVIEDFLSKGGCTGMLERIRKEAQDGKDN